MELPVDKQYHLFLSHSSQDEEHVIPILHILESEPYNLKCYIDRRDFMAGETTMANINHALRYSVATVFFLTPNFIESNYCNHEKEIAYSMFMEGGGRVIPVILKPCCLPDEFRNIHYIDDAFTDSFAEKIYKCFTTDRKEYNQLLPLPAIHAGNDRTNGSHFTCEMLCVLGKNERECFVSTSERIKFQKIGIQPDDEKLLMILNMIQCLPVDKRTYKLTGVKRELILAPFLWILVVIVVSNLPVQFLDMWQFFDKFSKGQGNGLTTIWTAMISPYLVLLMWIILVISSIVSRKVEIMFSMERLRTLNRLSVKDICCYFSVKTPLFKRPQFRVVKYDIAECEKYMERAWNEKCPAYVDEFTFEDIWTDINQPGGPFDMYFTKIEHENLPSVEASRHFVQNHKVCFCEYIDQVTSFEEVICKKLAAMKKKHSTEPQNQEEEMFIIV